MSLLSMASPWTNDESPIPRRRPSTMRRNIDKPVNVDNRNTYNSTNPDTSEYKNELLRSPYENFQNLEPTTIEDSQTINTNRNNTINELLNKMSSASDENSKLANFNPPPQPILNNRKPENKVKDNTNELLPTDLLPNTTIKPLYNNNDFTQKMGYISNDSNLGKLSNYKNSYEPSSIQLKPYYAQMGIGNGSLSGADNKLMEKINYMIHLLEEQQNEKTNNVTEEFILYSFLGIFIIFVVDSFARAGKYSR